MKNMKVKQKLVVSFLIVIVMAIMVGAVGIIGMSSINTADNAMYEDNYLPTVLASDISQHITKQRVYMRNFVIYDVNTDAEVFKSNESDLEESRKKMEELFSAYEPTISDPENRSTYDEFVKVYSSEWLPLVEKLHTLGTANKTEEAKQTLKKTSELADEVIGLSTKLQEVNMAAGQKTVNANTVLFTTLTIIEIIVLVIATVVALFLAFYISGLISKPLAVLTTFMNKAGTTGDITLQPEDIENIRKYSQVKDEIGQCVGSTANFANHMINISKHLETVASGDLTAEISQLSPNDVMGTSLNKMVENLNNMFEELKIASNQVSLGSNQVSQGAQGLASGSSQQAASIEELSAALSTLQEKTNLNAKDSGNAREANNKTSEKLEDSIRSMGQMLDAMKAIDESSSRITKVIKVIDDIAFQTNILALNAAVEAARAGQHGKGFAVVADEVRNLAAKSAEAAKETSALIEGSTERVKEGNAIVTKTNADLDAAVGNARESTLLIEGVVTASLDQAKSINEITLGMEQISTVVQANSATAEESAAAAEEMSAQAVVMNEIVEKFKLRQNGTQKNTRPCLAGGHSLHTKKDEQSGTSDFALSGGKY